MSRRPVMQPAPSPSFPRRRESSDVASAACPEGKSLDPRLRGNDDLRDDGGGRRWTRHSQHISRGTHLPQHEIRLRLPRRIVAVVHARAVDVDLLRSEEHTSELQSLMRISYAVFCLKKK